MQKRFFTLFNIDNVHLKKDVGMIPYILYKYYNYNSTIATYKLNSKSNKKENNYKYLNDFVKGLKIEFIPKITGNFNIDSIIYLINNSKRIDILNLYHFDKYSFIEIIIYKFLNKNGIVYLKLDTRGLHFKYIFRTKLRYMISKIVFNKRVIVSIELKCVYNYLRTITPFKIKYITNGVYIEYWEKMTDNINIEFCNKENIICTVGNIGTYVKATEILMEGFRLANKKIENWKLEIIGPIEDNFKEYIRNWFKKYPELIEKIKFVGEIEDIKILNDYYKKSKIFCLPSRSESFGIATIEAGLNGCYIIGSDIPATREIINNGEFGSLFKVDDYNELSDIFIKICNNQSLLEENCLKIHKYIKKNYSWKNICERLNKEILKYKNMN